MKKYGNLSFLLCNCFSLRSVKKKTHHTALNKAKRLNVSSINIIKRQLEQLYRIQCLYVGI